MAVRLPLMLCAAAVLVAGCSPIRGFNGYVVDRDLSQGIQPGIDNRASVERTLGRPSFVGQFGQGDWYYVSRNTQQFAFRTPRPSAVSNLRVRFAPDGSVAAVERTGMEQVASITPSNRRTPTLGRERSFFEEVFGGIGQVGSGLGGQGGNPSNTGGTP